MGKPDSPQRRSKLPGRLLVGLLVIGGPLAVGTMSAANSTASAGTPLTIVGSAVIGPGTLSIQASSTLKWSATLTGFDASVGAQLPLYRVVDGTGSGSGWSLSLSATQFTDSTGTTTCTSTKPCKLPPSALTVNGSSTTAKSSKRPVATCATGSTCTPPSYSKVAFPLTVSTGCSTGVCTPTLFASSAATTGMGAIDCAADWWLNLPGNAYAGTYTDTITATLASGP